MENKTKEKIIQIISDPYSSEKGVIRSQIWGLSNKGRLYFLESSGPAQNRWVLRAGTENGIDNKTCPNCNSVIK